MDINKMQRQVYNAIQRVPEAANDDALLLATVFAETWDDSKTLYENLKRAPRAESLTRRRRELYNMGLIQYSSDKLKERTEAFKKERYELPKSDKVEIAKMLDKLTIMKQEEE